MKAFDQLKIASRLMIGFGVLLVVIVAISALSVYAGGNAKMAIADITQSSEHSTNTQRIEAEVIQGRLHIWTALATGDAEEARKAEASFKTAHEYLDDLISDLKDPEQLEKTKAFLNAITAYEASSQKLLSIGGANAQLLAPAAATSLEDARQKGDAISDGGQKLSAAFETTAAHQIQQTDKTTAILLTAAVILGAISVALGLALSLIISRSINRPITGMTLAMGKLARGDLSVAVPLAPGRNEIADMGRAVQVFKENALRSQELEAQASLARSETEAERSRSDELRRASEAAQTKVVDVLADSLAKLARGDLTASIDVAFEGRYREIQKDFNAALDSLRATMLEISGVTTGLRTGSNEISGAAGDLARRTEQQAASLEQTAAALDQLTSTVRQSAENSKGAARAARDARADAERSGVIVQEAAAAMGEIENSSSQISKIIGVIDEIAFQTNLLALNAGVEAARAGESGKGFAVVAQEVRALALRSANAAREIKDLIENSRGQVEKGVGLVDDTVQALSGISARVSEIDGLISDIARASQEQTTGLDQVNLAVNQMDQMTQQNAAMVEQTTAAASGLLDEATTLVRLVNQFALGTASGVDLATTERALAGRR